jgi:hypothetical protein
MSQRRKMKLQSYWTEITKRRNQRGAMKVRKKKFLRFLLLLFSLNSPFGL